MSALKALLEDFQQGLIEADTSRAHVLLKEEKRLSPEEQLRVYIRASRLRLFNSVTLDFPALRAYMGEEAFDALLKRYVIENPSRHYNLDFYAFGFQPFLAQHTDDVMALSLAMLESSIAEVFFMAESEPRALSELNADTPESFYDLRLSLRHAGKLIYLPYPLSEYLRAFRKGQSPVLPGAADEYLFIYRHRNEIKRRVLQPLEYMLLVDLAAGKSIGEAIENADIPEQELEAFAPVLQQWLHDWLTQGLIRKERA